MEQLAELIFSMSRLLVRFFWYEYNLIISNVSDLRNPGYIWLTIYVMVKIIQNKSKK